MLISKETIILSNQTNQLKTAIIVDSYYLFKQCVTAVYQMLFRNLLPKCVSLFFRHPL